MPSPLVLVWLTPPSLVLSLLLALSLKRRG
jgi:hypothetical protein